MQYLVVYSSNPDLPTDGDWTTNGAGLKASHKYGFGVLDGSAIVNRARWWITVPPQENCNINVDLSRVQPATSSNPLEISIDTTSCLISYLEHTQAIITLELNKGPNKGQRKDVEILLQSPMGTRSILLPYRKRDSHNDGFHQWPFMTVHSWAEDPRGQWDLTVKIGSSKTEATLKDLQLVLYGTHNTPRSVRNVPVTCDTECLQGCAGAGPQYCDVCRHLQLATTFECVTACPTGTYEDLHMCRACPPLCAHCGKDSCITCVKGTVMLETGICSANCKPHTFLTTNGSCLSCHHSCLECIDAGKNSCMLCDDQFSLENGSCKVPLTCQAGMFFNGRSLECRPCHESCAECVGKGAFECSACYPGYQLEEGHCSVEHVKAKKCLQSEYYDSVEKKCMLCPRGCTKCTDNITCTSCDPGNYLRMERVGDSQVEVKTCVAECPRGFHGDTETLSCQPCPSDCETCTTPVLCTSCTLNYTSPVRGQCPQPCHTAEFFDFESSHCLQCFSHCLSCHNSASCIACKPGFFLLGSDRCVSACPKHLVEDEEKQRCIARSCHPSCETCFGSEPDECLRCPSNSNFFEHSCIEKCPAHTYHDQSSASCRHCHATCLSCAGEGESNCLQCPKGKIMDHFTCVSDCPKGSYVLDGKCVSCPPNCAVCDTLGECSGCTESFLLQNSECVEHCSEGYFSSHSTCEHCPSGCKTCSQRTLCRTCLKGFSYYAPNRSCIRQCPPGYFTRRGACSVCNSVCSQCNGPTELNCTTCRQGLAMNATSHKCAFCCNSDYPSRTPCCDCDTDDINCIAQTSPTPVQQRPARNAPSHRFGLSLVLGLVVLLLLAVMGIAGYYVWHKWWRRNSSYRPVPNPRSELQATLALVEDSESGSEAELYAKDDL